MTTLNPVPDDTPTPRTAVQASAEAFAAALVDALDELPDAEIADWFASVLEALDGWVLDGTVVESTYVELLERLRANIDERLQRGGW